MISSRIALDDINDAFDAMRKGTEARQVIMFD
jgi:Zn-dependent alcohol dehydrogenase